MADDGVVGQLKRLGRGLQWRQTYGAGRLWRDFLAGYGWSEFIGTRGPVASDRIAVGVLLLATGDHLSPACP